MIYNLYVATNHRNLYYSTLKEAIEEHRKGAWRVSRAEKLQWGSATGISPHAWNRLNYIETLSKPEIMQRFVERFNLLRRADIAIMLPPCNDESLLEMGWLVASSIPTCLFLTSDDVVSPTLNHHLMDAVITDIGELMDWLDKHYRNFYGERIR